VFVTERVRTWIGKATPLLHSKFNESQGQFSADGKWIAYVSDESGSPQASRFPH